ncbi:putative DNA-binding transcriptional regulator YafY [Paenibacillus harenae]|uniref:DNA-binding transcriptional regulator YafY n=1 Tax=Paenibacillus harenae TaxID=306543 RepID=A0ABT9UEI9_PAEHA|nr:putative DNA-binding transcriptional regulator YafY [Paenibacillus harenae]
MNWWMNSASPRGLLRDLQELSELGVPLYSEVGPHGGYQVVRERVLPPIAFTEGEAVAMFFAVHALRHYSSLPFGAESASALSKFYLHMPGDVRDRIDAFYTDFFISLGDEVKLNEPAELRKSIRRRLLGLLENYQG